MTIYEKMAFAAAENDRRRKDADRVSQLFAAVFSTDDGRELLTHLAKRFDLCGRTFIATESGELNPLRAAVRDGERAVVSHILSHVKIGNPDFKFTL